MTAILSLSRFVLKNIDSVRRVTFIWLPLPERKDNYIFKQLRREASCVQRLMGTKEPVSENCQAYFCGISNEAPHTNGFYETVIVHVRCSKLFQEDKNGQILNAKMATQKLSSGTIVMIQNRNNDSILSCRWKDKIQKVGDTLDATEYTFDSTDSQIPVQACAERAGYATPNQNGHNKIYLHNGFLAYEYDMKNGEMILSSLRSQTHYDPLKDPDQEPKKVYNIVPDKIKNKIKKSIQ